MNAAELFVLSEHALTNIVDQIKDDQWDLKAPPELTIKPGDWTIRKLINYHAYDDAWVPETLAGKTMAEVGIKYDGDLLGNDPKASWHAIVAKAIAAAKDVDLEKTVHLSYGDYPTHEYLHHITMFRTLRTVDFARFLKLDHNLSEELMQGTWDYLKPNAEMLRSYGILPPEVKVPEDAPLFERLMGLTGRQPK
jgi:uncharacterized protein (TIGR03086 family)